MVVGLTGKYCAGKNTIALEFEKRGFIHIDVDRLGHTALGQMKGALVDVFGRGILENGEISRKKLGAIVFSDENEKKKLEAVVHPGMVRMVKKAIEENCGGDVLINAAILFQMGLDSLCDIIVWADAPVFSRIKRALRRDGIPLKEILKRIIIQRNLNANIMKKKSDTYIIRNRGNSARIPHAVDGILKKINEGNR